MMVTLNQYIGTWLEENQPTWLKQGFRYMLGVSESDFVAQLRIIYRGPGEALSPGDFKRLIELLAENRNRHKDDPAINRLHSHLTNAIGPLATVLFCLHDKTLLDKYFNSLCLELHLDQQPGWHYFLKAGVNILHPEHFNDETFRWALRMAKKDCGFATIAHTLFSQLPLPAGWVDYIEQAQNPYETTQAFIKIKSIGEFIRANNGFEALAKHPAPVALATAMLKIEKEKLDYARLMPYVSRSSSPVAFVTAFTGLPPDKQTDEMATSLASSNGPHQVIELYNVLSVLSLDADVLKKIMATVSHPEFNLHTTRDQVINLKAVGQLTRQRVLVYYHSNFDQYAFDLVRRMDDALFITADVVPRLCAHKNFYSLYLGYRLLENNKLISPTFLHLLLKAKDANTLANALVKLKNEDLLGQQTLPIAEMEVLNIENVINDLQTARKTNRWSPHFLETYIVDLRGKESRRKQPQSLAELSLFATPTTTQNNESTAPTLGRSASCSQD